MVEAIIIIKHRSSSGLRRRSCSIYNNRRAPRTANVDQVNSHTDRRGSGRKLSFPRRCASSVGDRLGCRIPTVVSTFISDDDHEMIRRYRRTPSMSHVPEHARVQPSRYTFGRRPVYLYGRDECVPRLYYVSAYDAISLKTSRLQ